MLTVIGAGAACGVDGLAALKYSIASVEMTNSGPGANKPSRVRVQVTTAARAQELFTAFVSLPPLSYSTADTNCGHDSGVGLNFVFRDADGGTVATATIDPGGCEPASVTGENGEVMRGTALETPTFWRTLDVALDVTAAQLSIWSTPAAFLDDAGQDDGGGP
jgi:hypothetical protein